MIQEAMDIDGRSFDEMYDWCQEMKMVLEMLVQDVNNAMATCEKTSGTEFINEILGKTQFGALPYRSVYEDCETGGIQLQK